MEKGAAYTGVNTVVVIDCLRPESVSKLAWCNASLYGTNGKIICMARFCCCYNRPFSLVHFVVPIQIM